jgi:hypothetical protein
MRNQLRPCLLCIHIPNGTGGIDGRRTNNAGISLIPVERSERGTILGRFVVVQQRFFLHGQGPSSRPIIGNIPYPQVIARRRQQVFGPNSHICGPHDFRAGVRVVKFRCLVERSFVRGWILFDDGDYIGVLLHVRPDCQFEL